MTSELQQLQAAIAGLEAQRPLLGEAIAEAALVPLRARLASLSSSPLPDQSLKQVTILFLDVVGSTRLGQRLDPEYIHAVLDGALVRWTEIIEARGGKVLQYAGDSLLAVFGADEVQEDDPERAVHAGLDLLGEGRAQAEHVQHRYGHADFSVRIGIHTGGALLGGGVDGEHSIRGNTVNIAARMEQIAPAGALRISHDTYRQVRGVFDVEPQAPISVKGIDEPIVTYLVRRAKPRTFRIATRGIEGVETRMVGRDAELEQLRSAFKHLHFQGRLNSITIVAEAGLGKSRLLYEFDNWAQAQPEAYYLFRGRAHPQTRSHPYGLLRDILAWWLQIADDDNMEAAKEKFGQGIASLFLATDGADLAQAHAHLLGHLIGLDFAQSKHVLGIRDDARQVRSRALHAAAQVFRRLVAQGGAPVVVLIEDLHWADDGSLEFLKYLYQVNRDVPILMLATTRPTLFERRSEWSVGERVEQRINLSPLEGAVRDSLTNELLKKLPDTPPALHKLITEAGSGNPFYIEEFIKMLVDQGAITTGDERWSVDLGKVVAARIPPTLTGVLQARLDGLIPAEKLALQQASVVGFLFWDRALAAIDARSTEALPAVTRRELVVPALASSLDGVREYAFKHQILHDVTYNTVLKHLRAAYHAKVAEWLANLKSARSNEFLVATAEHFESAGDNRRACEFFARAAEYSAQRYTHEATLSLVDRALSLVGDDESVESPTMRWRLIAVRERTLDMMGTRDEQSAALKTLQGLAEGARSDQWLAEVALRRSGLAYHTGDYSTQRESAYRALELATSFQDDELRLNGLLLLTISKAYLGDADARAVAQRSLGKARELGLRRAEAKFLGVIASLEQELSLAGLEMLQHGLLIWRELGDKKNEAIFLCDLGISYLEFGRFIQAREYLEEGLRLTRAVGDRGAEPAALVNLSQLACWCGDFAAAMLMALAALDISVAVHAKDWEALAQWCIGNAELLNGRLMAATTAFECAAASARSIDHAVQRDATTGLARVALMQNDEAKALEYVEALLPYIASSDEQIGFERPRLTRLTCYQVLSRVGDSRAVEVLNDAHANLQALAAKIGDKDIRQSFLGNVPEHQKIVAAWWASEVRRNDVGGSDSQK